MNAGSGTTEDMGIVGVKVKVGVGGFEFRT